MAEPTIEQIFQAAMQHHQSGNLQEAERLYRQILQVAPDQPVVLHNLGLVAQQVGNLQAAAKLVGRAIQLAPEVADFLCTYAMVLKDLRRHPEAIARFRQALRISPDLLEAHVGLATALHDSGQGTEAIASYRKALDLRPDLAPALNNLAMLLQAHGRMDEAVAMFRKLVALRPDDPMVHSNLLLALLFQPNPDEQAIFNEHLAWAKRHAEPLSIRILPHPNRPDPERRLRIGYVSPDFRMHSVGLFLAPVLAHHDHGRFEILCYAHVPQPDAMTAQMQRHADQWHDIRPLSTDQAANLIRQHQVDILIDLAGHSGGNRLPIFAHKPAPVQIAWLGYQATNGMAAIDYRLTDARVDPPGVTERYHTERLLRLPETFACFTPPPDAPLVGPLPAIRNRFITFISVSRLDKVPRPMMALWAKVLLSVPDSRLVLLTRGLEDASLRQHVMSCFQEQGVTPSRLQLLGQKPFPEYLAFHNRVDIALDTYPFNGHTTTCQGLWMGVPIVTLAGEAYHSRMGLSVLTNLGLQDLIAHSEDDFVRIAGALAGDVTRLGELRQTLRQRMQSSLLLDAAAFTRNLESLYRQVWQDWCRTGKTSPA